ncbi:hypothetical protein Apa02nite_020060 [Actinoplanes palleronii]|uniref:Uncharacterized protein n=1 Tax=Actinoplanes palleronii TaxID=113570 RepID=A0ABQ4B5H0_9ACTN|nr:hypothetical protein Apa02nite_020060 [Actinoplanes palleronii]
MPLGERGHPPDALGQGQHRQPARRAQHLLGDVGPGPRGGDLAAQRLGEPGDQTAAQNPRRLPGLGGQGDALGRSGRAARVSPNPADADAAVLSACASVPIRPWPRRSAAADSARDRAVSSAPTEKAAMASSDRRVGGRSIRIAKARKRSSSAAPWSIGAMFSRISLRRGSSSGNPRPSATSTIRSRTTAGTFA